MWQKRIAARLEEDWRERLDWVEPDRLVVVRLPPAEETRRLEIYDLTPEEADRLSAQFGGQVRRIAPESWFFSQGSDQLPLRIRDRLLIINHPDALKSARDQYPEREALVIPPGMAFGTGEHATTITCLRFLVDAAREFRHRPWSMLDAGTGSGILSLAAEKLGATRIEGFDNNADSVRIAGENAEVNNCAQPKFYQADVLADEPEPGAWDVVAANIYSDILIQALPGLARALRRPGFLILSGILAKDGADVASAAKKLKLQLEKQRTIGKWTTFLYKS